MRLWSLLVPECDPLQFNLLGEVTVTFGKSLAAGHTGRSQSFLGPYELKVTLFQYCFSNVRCHTHDNMSVHITGVNLPITQHVSIAKPISIVYTLSRYLLLHCHFQFEVYTLKLHLTLPGGQTILMYVQSFNSKLSWSVTVKPPQTQQSVLTWFGIMCFVHTVTEEKQPFLPRLPCDSLACMQTLIRDINLWPFPLFSNVKLPLNINV